MRHNYTVPTEAFPIRQGQVWVDRDKRRADQIEVMHVGAGSVVYERNGRRIRGDFYRFPRQFDFVSNPPAQGFADVINALSAELDSILDQIS